MFQKICFEIYQHKKGRIAHWIVAPDHSNRKLRQFSVALNKIEGEKMSDLLFL